MDDLKFIDSHTHIYLEQFDNDREQVVKNACSHNVIKMLMPNVDSTTAGTLMKAARDFPGVCLPMMALHPTSVKQDWKKEMEFFEDILHKEKFIAIGETGLDLYWDKTFLSQQIICFKKHIELALEHKLPIVIHSRESLDEIFQVLDQYEGSGLKGVFHCFPGDLAQAEKATSMGFMLGIGGVVTYKNSLMAKVAEHIDLEFLLLETDAPYLPPVPYRGKRNESAYIPLIAQKIADIKQITLEQVARTTTDNTNKLFGLS